MFAFNAQSQTLQITNNINCDIRVTWAWMGSVGGAACSDIGSGGVTLAAGDSYTTPAAPPSTQDWEIAVRVDPAGANVLIGPLGTTGLCAGWLQYAMDPVCGGTQCQVSPLGGGNYSLNVYP